MVRRKEELVLGWDSWCSDESTSESDQPSTPSQEVSEADMLASRNDKEDAEYVQRALQRKTWNQPRAFWRLHDAIARIEGRHHAAKRQRIQPPVVPSEEKWTAEAATGPSHEGDREAVSQKEEEVPAKKKGGDALLGTKNVVVEQLQQQGMLVVLPPRFDAALQALDPLLLLKSITFQTTAEQLPRERPPTGRLDAYTWNLRRKEGLKPPD